MYKETQTEDISQWEFADNTISDDNFDLESHVLSSENPSSESVPSLSFASAATYLREGNDLVLTRNGESVVVKGYFAALVPPVLTTSDGAVISPEMVVSFLHDIIESLEGSVLGILKRLLGDKSETLAKDAVAIIESLEGSVLVIRNGKAIALQDGDQLFESDQISTETDSSLNIVFADGTQFKLGGQARIALDQFSYEASTSTGLQVISILSGAFAYASGLLAKNDPATVQLRTPVGEIGIRGTVIIGEVDAEDASASVTVVEGRVLYTDSQGEEYELDQGFDTVEISKGGEKVEEKTITPEKAVENYEVFDSVEEITEFTEETQLEQSQDDAQKTEVELSDIPLVQGELANAGNLQEVATLEAAVRETAVRDLDEASESIQEAYVQPLSRPRIEQFPPSQRTDHFFNLVENDSKVLAGIIQFPDFNSDTENLVFIGNDVKITFQRGVYTSEYGNIGRFWVGNDGATGESTRFSLGQICKFSICSRVTAEPVAPPVVEGGSNPVVEQDDLMIIINFDADGEKEPFRWIIENYGQLDGEVANNGYSIEVRTEDGTPSQGPSLLSQLLDAAGLSFA